MSGTVDDENIDDTETLDTWPLIQLATPNDVDVLYEKTRKFTNHEDGLVNQRLAWMLTFNGFLFTTYALSITAEANSYAIDGAHKVAVITSINQLREALTVAGFASAIVAAVGVLAALRAIRSVAFHYNYLLWRRQIRPYFPRIIGTKKTSRLGMACAVSTPFVVSGPWLYLFLKKRDFTRDLCGYSQSEIGAMIAITLTLSLAFFFTAVALFPELPDPFKRKREEIELKRRKKHYMRAIATILVATIGIYTIYFYPQIHQECSLLRDKLIASALLLSPGSTIAVALVIFMINPFQKSLAFLENHKLAETKPDAL